MQEQAKSGEGPYYSEASVNIFEHIKPRLKHFHIEQKTSLLFHGLDDQTDN